MDVQVLGFKALDQALAELPQYLRRPVVLGALKKGSRKIVRQARAGALRGTDPTKRGSKKQRKSRKSETIGHGADSIAARAAPVTKATTTTVTIGPDAAHWYMRFSEFGTSRQRKQAFLRPAFDANAEAAAQEVGEALWESLARAAERLRRQAESGKLSVRATRALS
jgi:HK97 gp10 family phage protein